MIPRAWQSEEQARIWWRVEYDRHVAAGFSDADSRLRCWEIARATNDPHKRALAARRRTQ